MPILLNPTCTRTLRATTLFDREFFGDQYPLNTNHINDLTFTDIHNGTRFYNQEEFLDMTGINLDMGKLTAIRSAFDSSTMKYGKNDI